MSWLLKFKRYKKKLKELLYYRSELDYQEDVLATAHQEFEEYYREYCAKRGIDLQLLNEENHDQVTKAFEASNAKTEGLIHKPEKKKPNSTKVFNSIYREVAKKIHPDKLSLFLPEEEIVEKTNLFKTASSAVEKSDWAKLLEVADKLGIKPKSFEGLEEQMDLEINKIKLIVQNNESTYSWVWAQCEDELCREDIVKNFLFQLFGFKN